MRVLIVRMIVTVHWHCDFVPFQCAARDAARWDVLARIESEQNGAAEAA
jgi:hypothetical protein